MINSVIIMSSKSPGPAKRKQFQLKILMLDDSEVPFQVDVSRILKNLALKVHWFNKISGLIIIKPFEIY